MAQDEPLFKDTDAQESTYAPNPATDPATRERIEADDGSRDQGDSTEAGKGAVLPAPGPGMSGTLHNMGQISGATPAIAFDTDQDEQDDVTTD
jgi:hypothetical protein